MGTRATATPGTAFRFPREVHVAEAELTDSYNSPSPYKIPAGARQIIAYVTYTTHASSTAGYPRFRPEWGNDAETGHQDILVGDIVTVPPITNGVGVRPTYLDEFNGPAPGAVGTTVKFRVVFDVLGGETTFTLRAKEVGDTTNRGTLAVALTAGS